ncbi:conserved hypothetical protein [delta proteobacterium NaphS2]|nr:conserved hypothetical protein [delta proteobacterium NaphS2]
MNKTLKTILSDTPLVKNLENKEYLDIILDGCNTLEQRFARVDSKLVLQELDKNKLKEMVHGGSAAVNRGADYVQYLAPALRA